MSQLKLNFKLPLKYIPDLKIGLVAVLYYLAARLGYFLVFRQTTDLPAWPPSGIAFALIILLGRSAWPGVTLGALVANILAYWNNQDLDKEAIIAISSFIALGQTLEVIFGNYLVKAWIKDSYPFRKARDTFRFLFVTFLMCVIGASIGTISLYVNGAISSEAVLRSAFTWWVGSVVGILLFTPFLLAASQKQKFDFLLPRAVEAGIFIVLMIGICFLLLNSSLVRALPYLAIPLVLWLAFRFNLLVTISFALAVSLVAIFFTIQSKGPFILGTVDDTLLLLQIFIGAICISAIVLSATVAERTQAENELTQFNSTLEAMVIERTKELSKRNSELDNFVYSVSHDLRAPIASVLGLINLAKSDADPKMTKTYLDKIYSSALQQDNFIREILDQSRNSRLEVKRDKIQFEELIDETFNQLKFATSTGTAVEKIVDIHQSEPFHSDRWRLKVILNNLISNSIRYRNGRDPVIKINVNVINQKVQFEIEDNGRGIAKEHIENVYRMFYRATDDGAGSGLGLYIVKETVDKLKGSISIESEEGHGTTVKLEIPELV
ncbi:MAG: MASE1 domain-containing protein [Cyclobacteriaceae bacterium]|nr:MASE1 domain-containing protein [Cyclobacteriaceae bacterium]